MTNEAAERLRVHLFNEHVIGEHDCTDELDAALAAERKATVERIRAALDLGPCHECENSDEIHRALDAEAAR